MGQVCRKPKKDDPSSKDKNKKKRKKGDTKKPGDDKSNKKNVKSTKEKPSGAENKTKKISGEKTPVKNKKQDSTAAAAAGDAAATKKSATEKKKKTPATTASTTNLASSVSSLTSVTDLSSAAIKSSNPELESTQHLYELDRSHMHEARAQLAEIERARLLLDTATHECETFAQQALDLSSRSSAQSMALRAETMYSKLHAEELERLETLNVELLAETLVYYDVLPRVYCQARRAVLEYNQKLIGTKKQQLFWHQSRLLHYEGLVENQERRIDNVIVMARYLRDHASDQGYLLWAERFRRLRDMARYIDSLRFETDELRSELSYLVDLNRVQLEEFGAKRLGGMFSTVNKKLTLLQDALQKYQRKCLDGGGAASFVKNTCQALATSVHITSRTLPRLQQEFLDTQLQVFVKLSKLFMLVSSNQRLRMKTRNAQMLAKIVSLCRKHNIPPQVWRETAARVRRDLYFNGESSEQLMTNPAWATHHMYDNQVQRQVAAAAPPPQTPALENNTAKPSRSATDHFHPAVKILPTASSNFNIPLLKIDAA